MNTHELSAVPKTVAIIMDGNRRYEKKTSLPKGQGHEAGFRNGHVIARACQERGVEQLTYWGGSKSNLRNRPTEVPGLFKLLGDELQHQMRSKNNMRFRLCGQLEEFTAYKNIIELIPYVEKKTKHNGGGDFTALFGYNARDEIVDMVRKIVALGIKPEEVDKDLVQKNLWTSHLRDVELLIRTGVRTDADPEGDEHWSDPFLAWQINNTRIIWSRTLWPEFTVEDLDKAFERFALCRPKQLMGA